MPVEYPQRIQNTQQQWEQREKHDHQMLLREGFSRAIPILGQRHIMPCIDVVIKELFQRLQHRLPGRLPQCEYQKNQLIDHSARQTDQRHFLQLSTGRPGILIQPGRRLKRAEHTNACSPQKHPGR